MAREELLDTYRTKHPLGHLTTTGGHPLSCAAGLASIEALREEMVLPHVEEKGALIEKKLRSHPRIHGFRRSGLMIGMDLKDGKSAGRLIQKAREKRVLLFNFLSHPKGVRIAPPLNIPDEDLEWGCDRILEALEDSGTG